MRRQVTYQEIKKVYYITSSLPGGAFGGVGAPRRWQQAGLGPCERERGDTGVDNR